MAKRATRRQAARLYSVPTRGCHAGGIVFERLVEQYSLALAAPAALVLSRQRLQIRRGRRRIVYPTAQQIATVDHVDRGPVFLVLVGKVAPDCVIRAQP